MSCTLKKETLFVWFFARASGTEKVFTYSEAAIEGKEDGSVAADDKELKSSCLFRVWRRDGTDAICKDGDDVFFEHLDTGKFLEAATDTNPLALADKDESSSGQLFGFFKQGRPIEMRHRDTVYLQTWLHNYIEYRLHLSSVLK